MKIPAYNDKAVRKARREAMLAHGVDQRTRIADCREDAKRERKQFTAQIRQLDWQ